MKYHILTTVSVLRSSHCGAEKNATWKQAAASSKLDFYNEHGQRILQLPLPLTFFKCFTAAFPCRRNVLAELLHCFWSGVSCYFQLSCKVDQILYINYPKLQLILGKFQA